MPLFFCVKLTSILTSKFFFHVSPKIFNYDQTFNIFFIGFNGSCDFLSFKYFENSRERIKRKKRKQKHQSSKEKYVVNKKKKRKQQKSWCDIWAE